jgi:hypothetical protein
LKQRKGRGSLTKLPGRTGTHVPRPSDLDLRVLIGSIQDLILTVAYGSGGQDRLGARAAALVAGAEAPAAALHRSWPKSAAPGSVGLRFGLGSMIVLHVIHLGPRLVSGRAGVARATAAAGWFTPASDSMPTEAEKRRKKERTEVSYPRAKLRR